MPAVIELIVKQELCIGCGMCVTVCPNEAIEMQKNEIGFFVVASKTDTCRNEGECLKVCPFNVYPGSDVRTESEIRMNYFEKPPNHDYHLGSYFRTYAGYSHANRLSSSSGGIGTWLLVKLFEKKIISKVVVVSGSLTKKDHYEYAIVDNVRDIRNSSGTKYYPVKMDEIIHVIKTDQNNKYAIVGVPCFIKAIRLGQVNSEFLKTNIVFTIGLFCGGLKSSCYTDFLASYAGTSSFEKPVYRIKHIDKRASFYSFACQKQPNNEQLSFPMYDLGDMWGTGLFKAFACEFCDDLSGELADISIGDAWVEPYKWDGKGNNIVITRSLLSEELINEGIASRELKIDFLNLSKVNESQRGNIYHRHYGLKYRLFWARKMKLPPKRVHSKFPFCITRALVMLKRMETRRLSHKIWAETKEANIFLGKMKKELKSLEITTKVNHFFRFRFAQHLITKLFNR